MDRRVMDSQLHPTSLHPNGIKSLLFIVRLLGLPARAVNEIHSIDRWQRAFNREAVISSLPMPDSCEKQFCACAARGNCRTWNA
jgi:hypothetical protein